MILNVDELPMGYPTIDVPFNHPNVDENYMNGIPQPDDHPSIEEMLLDYLPPNHPQNLDEMLHNPSDFPQPFGHPSVNSMLLRGSADPTTRPTNLVDTPATEVSMGEVEVSIESNQTTEGDSLEGIDVDIEDDQTIMLEDLFEDLNIEGNQTTTEEDLLEEDEVYVEDDQPISEEKLPEEDDINIDDDKPIMEDVEVIIQGDPPSGSPTPQTVLDTVESMIIEVLPTDIPFSVYSGHRTLMKEMIVPPFKHHPTVSHLFMAHQPPDHPNIDDLIEEGFTLPRWHPSISHMIAPRSLVASPGSLLCYALSALVVVALVLRNCKHWHNSKRSIEKSFPGKCVEKNIIDETRMSSSDESSSQDNGRSPPTFPPPDLSRDGEFDPLFLSLIGDTTTLSRLDQNHHKAMEISRMHNDSDAEPVKSSIIAYREKRNTRLSSAWIKILGKRALGTHSSNGELVFCMFYVALNSLALLLSPYDLNVGFGSLAAGNIVFLVVSAIKNSVLTWFLGMAFDQVIVYHQFIGRVTVVTSFIHSCFYFNRLVEFMSDRVYKTGFIALMFGIFITISSLNWIRRKYFNVFYWSHIAFVGFIVCVFLHARGARPFILVSVASYVVDKVLHMMWTQLPRKTLRIEPVGEGGKTTFVRISKTPLNQLLGRHKVGQWVVVNFPELSLTEWHVSC